MALKDLTEYLAPNLDLPLAGKTYSISPPSRDAGLKLAAIVAVGTAETTGQSEAATDEQRALIEASTNDALGDLSLGADVHAAMVADGVPSAHIDTAAMYAMYYWVLGETAADRIFEAQADAKAGGAAPKAKAPARSKSGRSTASGSRKTTSTASRSTRTTASPKAQPGASSQKDPGSGGPNS